MSFKSADRPETDEGMQYHLRVKPGDLIGPVLLPGDPKRAHRIAKSWDEATLKADYRQFVSYTGTYKGVPISVTSTGIGPAACEIVLPELHAVNVRDVIRVGSCGALQEDIAIGDLIITTGAVRLEDSSSHYVRSTFPAMANYELTLALIRACEENNLSYHVGITASSSSFYGGQGRPLPTGYLSHWSEKLYLEMKQSGVLNFEMEASLIFVLAHLLGMRATAISAVYANRATNEFGVKGEEKAILAANEAVRILHDIDEDKRKRGITYWFPKDI